jgi:hypothetical protein
MSAFQCWFRYYRDIFIAVACVAITLGIPQGAFAWGREGHEVIVIVAEHYMRPETASRMRELLAPEGPEEASVWADEYRRDHRETGPWHYINIPLADSKIDMARECANGDCVIAKTEQFLAVLKDPKADKDAKGQALRFVIHFVGDMHQPLHVADNGDRGGNTRHVIFGGHPDNLHWVWDSGLFQHITNNPAALAEELESRITPRDQAEWQRGSIEDWVMEGHRLAQTVAYGDLGNENPAPINPVYEREADPVIELQLEKAGVRLAYLLDANLMQGAAGQNTESKAQTAVNQGNPDVKVWVNTNSGAYHCPGTRWFGKTHEGEYMAQKEAQNKGYHPAANQPCM